jgi:hypothetical protein
MCRCSRKEIPVILLRLERIRWGGLCRTHGKDKYIGLQNFGWKS